ncbi:hypothetical protein PR202_ga20411 [Eleusine coracana subsp. coracana]|uniref:Mitochondrial fission protein ELM1 n=1 Tax=Eleusine coracana subsp. coracana TaxID=191504 RepID=A0AAV5CWL6_ELECO|nr:hypothetical protein PR202_ga20411 [Eleusine coracana subsp. coracana]
MRPIRLPERRGGTTPEIFAAGEGAAVVRRAVVIGNGCAGAENQCLGLLRALGLADRLTLYIQHPRFRLDRFDLVVTPRHDYYALTARGQQEVPHLLRRWITPLEPPGLNVVLTTGALHQADSAALHFAAIDWHAELAPLPKPLVVVNIGGPTRNCKYDVDLGKQLVSSLHNVLKTCGSVRISFSRRTPQKMSDLILKEFSTHPKIYIWDGKDPNPHLGHLAWADAFIITADSVSMLSEATSTGKPVYVIGAEHYASDDPNQNWVLNGIKNISNGVSKRATDSGRRQLRDPQMGHASARPIYYRPPVPPGPTPPVSSPLVDLWVRRPPPPELLRSPTRSSSSSSAKRAAPKLLLCLHPPPPPPPPVLLRLRRTHPTSSCRRTHPSPRSSPLAELPRAGAAASRSRPSSPFSALR